MGLYFCAADYTCMYSSRTSGSVPNQGYVFRGLLYILVAIYYALLIVKKFCQQPLGTGQQAVLVVVIRICHGASIQCWHSCAHLVSIAPSTAFNLFVPT
jgi:hypothetical protein